MSEDKARESALWKWIASAQNLIVNPLDLHMVRIENDVSKNTPDVEGCYRGFTFFVELKSLATLRQLPQKLTQGQAMFLHARAMAGGAAYLLLELPEGRYLLPGNVALDLVDPQLPAFSLRDLEAVSLIRPKATALEVLKAICGII